MKTKFVPRVNQLDALQLDNEIRRILNDQLVKVFGNLSPGILSKYQPELDLIIRTMIWNFSIRKSLSSFGQNLLSITYDKDQLSSTKLGFHYVLTVLINYIKDNLTMRFTSSTSLQRSLEIAENIYTFLNLINLFRFLKYGQKPTVVDYILRLDHISMFGNKRRNVGYSYMTRELIWGGFIELLGFTIPLVNYSVIKRNIRNFFNIKSGVSSKDRIKVNLNINTKCAFCNERPTLPHHMDCGHIFCYYCIKSNKIEDPNYQCNVCDFNGESIHPVSMMQV